MIIQCSKCGKEIERRNRIKNAVCFECKKNMGKERYEKYRPKREVQRIRKTNPELYNISWEEIRKRVAKIDKENIKEQIAKIIKSKSKYQLK